MKESVRNLLIGAGAYFLGMWVAPPVVMLFAPFTNRVGFDGDFEYVVVMPLVLGIPMMLVAAGTGAITAWLVHSRRHWLWAVPSAILFAAFNWSGNKWVKPPERVDYLASAVRAVLPAVACLLAALAVEKRQQFRATSESDLSSREHR